MHKRWIGLFIFATSLMTSAQASWDQGLKRLLQGTTWCFQDAQGPRANGRMHFYKNGSGLFDVVDAPPGAGGIAFGWNTLENPLSASVMIEFAPGMKPTQQWAVVEMPWPDNNHMVWHFSAFGEESHLTRCR